MKYLLICFCFLLVMPLKAQSDKEKELLQLPVEQSAVFKNEKEFHNLYVTAIGTVLNDNPDKAFRIALDLERIAIKSEKPELSFLADYFLGRCYYFFNDAEKAIKSFSVAGKTAVQQHWYTEQAKISLYMGSVFQLKHNRQQGEEYYFKALELATSHPVLPSVHLEIYEKIGFLNLVIRQPENIAKGRKFFSSGLKLAEKVKDTAQIGVFTIRLGQIEFAEKNRAQAFRNMHRGINYVVKANDTEEMMMGYKSLGDMFYSIHENDSALYYYKVCYELRRNMGQSRIIAVTATDLAYMYGLTGQPKLLDQYADTALKYAYRDRSGDAKFYVYQWLADIYNITRNKDRSIMIYAKYVKALDSTVRSATDQALARQGLQMDFDNQMEIVQLKQEREKEIRDKEEEHQRFLSRVYLVGFLVLLVFFAIIFRELRRNKKQKKIIEAQNQEVTEKSRLIAIKNKEMTDSINYAQRIQAGLLSSKDNLLQLFPGSFLYYNPKDILSGDFYWYCEKGDFVFVACGDCTGHGVPGALMSVLGINLLTDLIEGKNITEPAAILDQLRLGIIRSLNKDLSKGEYKDGMDIALVRLNGKTGECIYAGANNPAYHIVDKDLKEAYQANKQPVGFATVLKPFDQHVFQVKKGDMIVLFTDGFPDQFGGIAGKKLMYKPFRQLLLDALRGKNVEDTLHRKFMEWRGNNEQIDDICVVGIKI